MADRISELESLVKQLFDECRTLREELARVLPPAEGTAAANTSSVSAPSAPRPASSGITVLEKRGAPVIERFAPAPTAVVVEQPVPQFHSSEEETPTSDLPRRPFVKWLPTTDAELPMIEARCRIKAEASRWAEYRRRLLAQGVEFRADVEPRDRDLIYQAKQIPDCFLWMAHSTAPNPSDPNHWLMLAGCFEVLAETVSLVRKIQEEAEDSTEAFEQAVDLLAEAQSALRVAVMQLEGPPTDHDQARVFGWLKNVAMNRQIFIRRYMRLDDPADPNRWQDLKQRVVEYQSRFDDSRKKVLSRKKALGRLKYKLTHLPGPESSELQLTWVSIGEDIHELVQSGMPPSNVELRDMLLEHADRLPEMAKMPKGFQLAVREIDRYLATAPSRPSATDEDVDVTTPQVAEVAEMLAGKAIILIGGDRRPHAAEALEKAFHLSELIWIDTRAHESISGFEPYVARAEVAMVLLAIRWSSHSYGEVQDFCRAYGKPLVRLPGGYNKQQVAAQILEQCSQRLVGNEASLARVG